MTQRKHKPPASHRRRTLETLLAIAVVLAALALWAYLISLR